jgi:hypothetical protein
MAENTATLDEGDVILSVEMLTLTDLSDRERYVFGRRRGLTGLDDTRLSTICKELALSREAVRQIARSAESKVTREVVSQWVPHPTGTAPTIARCKCGKYKGRRFKGVVCERCNTEVA